MMRGKKGQNRADSSSTSGSVDYEEVDLRFRVRMKAMVPPHLAERIQRILKQRREHEEDVEAV